MIKSRKMILSLAALSVLAASQLALATPGNISIRLDCPDISAHEADRVTNYGNVITGPGIERVGPNPSTFPMFAGVNPGGVPIDLIGGGYSNSGTSYDPSTGIVTCSFASSNPNNPSFDLTHPLKNGFDGIVTKSTSEQINIKFTMGSKA